MAGNFVVRKALSTVESQGFLSELHTRLHDHTGRHQLSPLRIRYAEDRDLPHRWMPKNDSLDLAAIDVFAACDGLVPSFETNG
jgi:hypothetical protein